MAGVIMVFKGGTIAPATVVVDFALEQLIVEGKIFCLTFFSRLFP